MSSLLKKTALILKTCAISGLAGTISGCLAVLALYARFHEWYREEYRLPVGEDGGAHEGFEFVLSSIALFLVVFSLVFIATTLLIWYRRRKQSRQSIGSLGPIS